MPSGGKEPAHDFSFDHAPGLIADYVVAATAEFGGLALVTLNLKRFAMIENLQAPY